MICKKRDLKSSSCRDSPVTHTIYINKNVHCARILPSSSLLFSIGILILHSQQSGGRRRALRWGNAIFGPLQPRGRVARGMIRVSTHLVGVLKTPSHFHITSSVRVWKMVLTLSTWGFDTYTCIAENEWSSYRGSIIRDLEFLHVVLRNVSLSRIKGDTSCFVFVLIVQAVSLTE